jgi:uncharacterized protein (TIGR00730 family)
MKKIGIFCSASERINHKFIDDATEVGTWIGSVGGTLVYGGCNLGLMEATARAVKAAGGKVTGVVPDIMEEKQHQSTLCDKVIPCGNLSERKDIMTAEADILVALPGGVGTLDELFSVMSAHSIGYHQKMMVLYNAEGFWNELIHTLHVLDQKGFMNVPLNSLMLVANTFDELKNILQKY